MALHIPKAPGYMSMMKEGARYFEGLEEAVFRNIEACIGIAKTTRSTYGPAGQNKIVINHIGRQFVTNDAATILKELEVAHPAAKLLVLATQQQEQEAGDGTNLVFQLAGALLESARELLKIGLSVTQVVEGFEIAETRAIQLLDEIVVKHIKDLRNLEEVTAIIRTAISSKQPDLSEFLAQLIAKACVHIFPERASFNVDNVRVLKVLGSGVTSSTLHKGMVFRRDVEGDVRQASKCKIAIFSCPLDTLQTETKGTVLIHTAEELTQFSKGEETHMEKELSEIAAAGANVIVTGGKVGELALHYANKMGLMIVRLNSKFDIRRLCQATGATALPTLRVPTTDELGYAENVESSEIADVGVVIFEHLANEGSIVTILVRGSTENIMDDIERAIDDGVNTFKCLTRSPKVVAGGGAVEIELARRMLSYADTVPGLEQYAIREFSRSFEVVPRALAENAGEKATEVIAQLYASHQAGDIHFGLITKPGQDPAIGDAATAHVLDVHAVKHWAIQFATTAACTVLRVDQIIMARPAGGPKPREPKANDED